MNPGPFKMSTSFTKRRVSLAVLALFLLVVSLRASSSDAPRGDAQEELSGGDTTVFDATVSAFGFSIHNLKEEHRASFFVGHSFFDQNWVAAPASTAGRDGLGPLFNARSCSSCHAKDGRDHPPVAGEPMHTMLLRISVPGTGPHGEPNPDPTYGGQLQSQAILGARPEAECVVTYQEVAGQFGDGEKFSLRRPVYSVRNFGYGPMATNAMLSPRVAPAMIGLGLLEAVPEETLRSLVSKQAGDGEGISGRLNLVWDCSANKMRPGRFGWKAEQPTVLQQAAAAFNEDIGITSSLMPVENFTKAESACASLPCGGHPEVSDKIFSDVVLYSRALAVPARRNCNDPRVKHGELLFTQANCSACHVPKLQTGDFPELPELSHQTIHPYTDLLLHDMGEGLSDHRPVFDANGRDWRTAPLWGIGLVPKVNGHSCFLHDGRARNLEEAILWHDGEARATKEAFRTMPKQDREDLIAFLESL